MPQIILKERATHLALHFSLQVMLINTKTRHFHSSINHQEQLFHRTLITGYFRLVNIDIGLFYRTPPEAVVCRYSPK